MQPDVPDRLDPCAIFATDALARLDKGHVMAACRPIENGVGADFVQEHLLGPLAAALPRYDVRADIAVRGRFNDQAWTASSGHLFGVFAAPLFGIAPTSRIAYVRFGCFQYWSDQQVAETLLILDLPSLMLQAGVWPMAMPCGSDVIAPAPIARDGIWPIGGGADALSIVERMISGLMKFDGTLATMNMRDYFAQDFWWFGPAPIGSFRGFPDYERGHATPFLTAFPDRVGGNHRARFGNGSIVASTGWPSISATHTGSGWLGLPSTNRKVTMRVMDFWAAAGGMLVENWVMIDIPDVLHQLGIDVFAASMDRS